MSPEATAAMTDAEAQDRVHAVIKALDPSFDLPDTSEGIRTLTHIRSGDDLQKVLSWLSEARQFALYRRPGWASAPAAAAQAAAAAWTHVRSSFTPLLRPSGCIHIGIMLTKRRHCRRTRPKLRNWQCQAFRRDRRPLVQRLCHRCQAAKRLLGSRHFLSNQRCRGSHTPGNRRCPLMATQRRTQTRVRIST